MSCTIYFFFRDYLGDKIYKLKLNLVRCKDIYVCDPELYCPSPSSDMQVPGCLSSMNTKIRRQGEEY
jgi:hypothetical protein